MSGEGNPNHGPDGKFASGGGGGGIGKTPRKVRTASRSTKVQVHGAEPTAHVKAAPAPQANKVQVHGTGLDKQPLPPAKGGVHGTMDAAATAKLMSQPPIRGTAHAAFAAGNPGYGSKGQAAPIPGGLKDPKPIDPTHVPPKSGRAARTAARQTTPAERRKEMGIVDVAKIKTPEAMQADREQRRLAITGGAGKSPKATEAATKIMKKMDLPTEVRGRDRLDFHDVHVSTIKDSLNEAYKAGGGTHSAQAAAKIAEQDLGVKTFHVANSDRQDFHNVGVANMKEALVKAYDAGAAEAKTPSKKDTSPVVKSGDQKPPQRRIVQRGPGVPEGKVGFYEHGPDKSKKEAKIPEGQRGMQPTGRARRTASRKPLGESLADVSAGKPITDR